MQHIYEFYEYLLILRYFMKIIHDNNLENINTTIILTFLYEVMHIIYAYIFCTLYVNKIYVNKG